MTENDHEAAARETERLTRQLDITNADHIALWLEANKDESPLGWLACRIAEAFEAQLAEVRAAASRKRFPILGSRGATIDWQLVADHGKQAQANHYQTVERLAERGGLAWSELYAVLHNRPWQQMDENTAIVACRALEAEYLAPAERDATIARLTAALRLWSESSVMSDYDEEGSRTDKPLDEIGLDGGDLYLAAKATRTAIEGANNGRD